MRWMYCAIALLALCALGRCVCAPEPAPGGEGDYCDDESPCASGLRCVDGECVIIAADGGSSDAGVGDGAAADAAGADLVVPDSGDGDRVVPDTAGADQAPPPDSGPVDRGPQPDVERPDQGTFDRGSQRDTGHRPDHAVFPDGIYIPDTSGHDFASLLDAHINVDGGLGVDVVGIDAGISEYTGTAEDGVVCGTGIVCDEGDSCCVNLPPALACESVQTGCAGAATTIDCDGPEDCNNGEECCAGTLSTYCTAEGTCLDQGTAVICVTAEDCPTYSGGVPMVCCNSSLFAGMGVDIGWCQTGC